MELLKYLMAFLVLQLSTTQKFYYKQDGNAFDVYYGPSSLTGYQQMLSPKSFKPFYDQRRVRPGKCQNGNFNCTEDYEYELTKNFECQYDYQCPKDYKCCQPECFRHKVCQPLLDVPFDQLTTPQEVETITTEQPKITTSLQTSESAITTTKIPTTTVTTTTQTSRTNDAATEVVPTTSVSTISSSGTTTERLLTTTKPTPKTTLTTTEMRTSSIGTTVATPETVITTSKPTPKTTTTTTEISTSSIVSTVATPKTVAPTREESTIQKTTTTQTTLTTKLSSVTTLIPSTTTTVPPSTTSAELTPSLASVNSMASSVITEQTPSITTLTRNGITTSYSQSDSSTKETTEQPTTRLMEITEKEQKPIVESSRTTFTHNAITTSEQHIFTSLVDVTDFLPTTSSTVSPDKGTVTTEVSSHDESKKVTASSLEITELNQTITVPVSNTEDGKGLLDNEDATSASYFNKFSTVTTPSLKITEINKNRNVPLDSDDEDLLPENGSGNGVEPSNSEDKTQETTRAESTRERISDYASDSRTGEFATTKAPAEKVVNDTDFDFSGLTVPSQKHTIKTTVPYFDESRKLMNSSVDASESNKNSSVPILDTDDEDLAPENGSGDGTDSKDISEKATAKSTNEKDDQVVTDPGTRDYATMQTQTQIFGEDTEFDFISSPIVPSQNGAKTNVSVPGESEKVTAASTESKEINKNKNIPLYTDDEDLVSENASGDGLDMPDSEDIIKITKTAKTTKATDEDVESDLKTENVATTKATTKLPADNAAAETIAAESTGGTSSYKEATTGRAVTTFDETKKVTITVSDITKINKNRNTSMFETDDEDLVVENGSGNGADSFDNYDMSKKTTTATYTKDTTDLLANNKTFETTTTDSIVASSPFKEAGAKKTVTNFDESKKVATTLSDITKPNINRNIPILVTDDEDLNSRSGSGDGVEFIGTEELPEKVNTPKVTNADFVSTKTPTEVSKTELVTNERTSEWITSDSIGATPRSKEATTRKTVTHFDESKKVATTPSEITKFTINRNISMLETDDEDLMSGSGSGDGIEFRESEESKKVNTPKDTTGNFVPTKAPKIINEIITEDHNFTKFTDIITGPSKILQNENDDEDFVEGSGAGTEAKDSLENVPTKLNIPISLTNDDDFLEGSGARDMSPSTATPKLIVEHSDLDDFNIDDSGEGRQSEVTAQKNNNDKNGTSKMDQVKSLENSLAEYNNISETTTKVEHKETEIANQPLLEDDKETTTAVFEESKKEFQELKIVMSTSIPYNVGTTLDRSLFFPSKEEPPKRILKVKKVKPMPNEDKKENSDGADKKANNRPSYSAEGNKNNLQRTTVKVSTNEKEYFDKENDNYVDNEEEEYLIEHSGSGDYAHYGNLPVN